MKEILHKVKEFHEHFNIENGKSIKHVDTRTSELRYKLGLEELDEYKEACENNDLIGIADALGDQLYILVGTILKHGMQDKIVEVFEEIQRSNMSKLGEDGLPILREDGKILKSNLYSPPKIKEILEQKK